MIVQYYTTLPVYNPLYPSSLVTEGMYNPDYLLVVCTISITHNYILVKHISKYIIY